MTAPAVTHTHIVLDERGRAWIEGTNTKVVEVVLDKLAHGWGAEEIHRHHPHLPLSKVHAALSYYYDHQGQIDEEIALQLRDVDALRAVAGESHLAAQARARLTAGGQQPPIRTSND